MKERKSGELRTWLPVRMRFFSMWPFEISSWRCYVPGTESTATYYAIGLWRVGEIAFRIKVRWLSNLIDPWDGEGMEGWE